MGDGETLKLSCFNSRGLGESGKRRAVFRWLKKYYNGIIFLQETHTCETSLAKWKTEWSGQIEMSHGTSTSRGVAILISPEINITINETIKDNT